MGVYSLRKGVPLTMSAAREPVTTLSFVNHYCARYQDLFPDVRSFEHFKLLDVGLMSELPRKSLPALAKAVGLPNDQALHHFLSTSPWNVEVFRPNEPAYSRRGESLRALPQRGL
jgi:hypothetical protein